MDAHEESQGDLITRAEAARVAGVHVRTIDMWRRRGALHTYLSSSAEYRAPGTTRLIKRGELLALLGER
jgi:hypothetical protein